MADFNFGFVGSALEAGRHAEANMDFGPVSNNNLGVFDVDWGDFIVNEINTQKAHGPRTEFIWGQKWGNAKTRVAE